MLNKLNSIKEMEDIALKKNGIYLYGAGTVCNKILNYLESKNEISYINDIFVTCENNNLRKIHGIEIKEYSEDIIFEKYPLVITVISLDMQNEILKQLGNTCKEEIYILQKEFEKHLDHMLREIKYVSAKEKINNYVNACKIKEKSEDIRFFSLPYWDAYSPFSAVPCLVGWLQKKGYKAGQVDLGILCFHWLIKHKWKKAAEICLSEEFYDNYVRNYIENTYESYMEFVEDIWFLKTNDFHFETVKNNYLQMNAVQKRVLDAFYTNIYSFDISGFDFERCVNLAENIENYIESDFLNEIVSEEIISVFRGLPEIIGVSITSTEQFLPACLFAKIVKELWPNKVIIMGGSCADLFIKSQYRNKKEIYQFFDYIIIGEGETAISKLMDYLMKEKGECDTIPNLLHIDEHGEPYLTEQIIEDVNMLPAPNYDGVDLSLYLSVKPILPYQSSRGCHYGHCAFCNHDDKYRHHYRTKDMKKVVEELVFLSKRYEVKNFQFVDEAVRPDCFQWMIAEMDKNKEFRDIRWFYYSRVSRKYNVELLNKAYKNGCRMVMFGIESFNQRLLNFIRKGISAETSKYCLEIFHNCGIKTYAWLMCNLPSETIEEAERDLADVQEMGKYIDAFSVGPFFLSKNTDMYLEPEKFNITYIDDKNQCRFMSHNGGKEIDKDEMLNFFEQKYSKLQRDTFSAGNRYTLFWET